LQRHSFIVITHGKIGFPLETIPARNMRGERTRQEHAGQELPFQNRKGEQEGFYVEFCAKYGHKTPQAGQTYDFHSLGCQIQEDLHHLKVSVSN
jgi:hypothetical protein